jgi:hypothetical protein
MTGFVRDAFGTTSGLFGPTMLASAGEAGFAAAGAGAQDGVTKVRGVEQSGQTEDAGDGGASEASALATPFGDMESSPNSLLSLLLLIAVVVSAVFVLRGISNALR